MNMERIKGGDTLPCLVLPQPYASEIIFGRWEAIGWQGKKPKLQAGRVLIAASSIPRIGVTAKAEDQTLPADGGGYRDLSRRVLGEIDVTQVVPQEDCQLATTYPAGWAIIFKRETLRAYKHPPLVDVRRPWKFESIPEPVVAGAEAVPFRTALGWVQGIRDNIAMDEAAKRGHRID